MEPGSSQQCMAGGKETMHTNGSNRGSDWTKGRKLFPHEEAVQGGCAFSVLVFKTQVDQALGNLI